LSGGASGGWDDWDPDDAHRGYTGKMGILDAAGGVALPGVELPGASDELTPAGQAALERAAAADYLTVEYTPDDPGFVEVYDTAIVPRWSTPFGRLLLSVFLTQTRATGWQVLDAACGTGFLTIELARYLGQDCDVAGLDRWEAAIARARRKAGEEWLRNIAFIAGDICQSGLPDGTFDTITCNLGLPSFADPRAALGAMARLLHPGGTLLATAPLQSALREFLDTYYLTLRDLTLSEYKDALARQIAQRPALADLRALLEATGFEVERTVTESFTLSFPDPRAFLTSPIVQTTYMPAWRGLIADLTVRRLVFNEVERRLQARIDANGGRLDLTVPMVCLVGRRL
jgi:ubiquinone/menaquinone biosynthesis C-methylase UbiE